MVASRRQAQQEALALFQARQGHFQFESGHHGDLWLDIPLAYVRPARLRPHAARLAGLLEQHRIEVVCGPLVEGAFLAQMVAEELDVEFCFAQQFTTPNVQELFPVAYRIPGVLRAGLAGKRTAIVDDVINAGSAVGGAIVDLKSCRAELVAIGALLVLGARAAALAASERLPLEVLSHIEHSSLWEPSSCPLCSSGVPIDQKVEFL